MFETIIVEGHAGKSIRSMVLIPQARDSICKWAHKLPPSH
jgi:hypothetical protein